MLTFHHPLERETVSTIGWRLVTLLSVSWYLSFQQLQSFPLWAHLLPQQKHIHVFTCAHTCTASVMGMLWMSIIKNNVLHRIRYDKYISSLVFLDSFIVYWWLLSLDISIVYCSFNNFTLCQRDWVWGVGISSKQNSNELHLRWRIKMLGILYLRMEI